VSLAGADGPAAPSAQPQRACCLCRAREAGDALALVALACVCARQRASPAPAGQGAVGFVHDVLRGGGGGDRKGCRLDRSQSPEARRESRHQATAATAPGLRVRFCVVFARGCSAGASGFRLKVLTNRGVRVVNRIQLVLIRRAVDAFLHHQRVRDPVPHLHQGRGLWSQRSDLPDWAALRSELDR